MIKEYRFSKGEISFLIQSNYLSSTIFVCANAQQKASCCFVEKVCKIEPKLDVCHQRIIIELSQKPQVFASEIIKSTIASERGDVNIKPESNCLYLFKQRTLTLAECQWRHHHNCLGAATATSQGPLAEQHSRPLKSKELNK